LDKVKKDNLKRLGRFVKSRRVVKNLSTCQIENEFGLDRALWSKLENGKLTSVPKPEFLINIAKILNINCVELYILAGFMSDKNIMEYIIENHRVREKDHRRRSFKP